MVVTYLEGGLGNMIFQIAFTLAQSEKHNAEYFFLNYNENFQIIQSRHSADIDGHKNDFLRNVKFSSPPIVSAPQILHHCPFEYTDLPYEPGCYNIYKGYFQSEKFFDGFEEQLLGTLTPTQETLDYIHKKYSVIFNRDCVATHIRRGDYLSLPYHHPVLATDYYHRSFKQFDNVDKILVFTNDINWCYENLKESRAIFVEESDWMSLYIMSMCKNHVIANSSFSWWGARLAEMNYGKDCVKVVAPDKWFGPAVQDDYSGIVPARWIKMVN